jgi:hypothetical protein
MHFGRASSGNDNYHLPDHDKSADTHSLVDLDRSHVARRWLQRDQASSRRTT